MRKFVVIVKFDLTNEKVVNCIMNNFDYDKMNNDGVIEMFYTSRGNKNSTEESVIKGMKRYLNSWESFKRGYTILGVKEITK